MTSVFGSCAHRAPYKLPVHVKVLGLLPSWTVGPRPLPPTSERGRSALSAQYSHRCNPRAVPSPPPGPVLRAPSVEGHASERRLALQSPLFSRHLLSPSRDVTLRVRAHAHARARSSLANPAQAVLEPETRLRAPRTQLISSLVPRLNIATITPEPRTASSPSRSPRPRPPYEARRSRSRG